LNSVLGSFVAIGAPDRPYCADRAGAAALGHLGGVVRVGRVVATDAVLSKGVQPGSGRTDRRWGRVVSTPFGWLPTTVDFEFPIVCRVAGDVFELIATGVNSPRGTRWRRWCFGRNARVV